jgi:hypothetical protein
LLAARRGVLCSAVVLLARAADQDRLGKRDPLGRLFAGSELRPMPDGIVQLPEPDQGGVFDLTYSSWRVRHRVESVPNLRSEAFYVIDHRKI